jgi:hypothetical protein
MVGPVYRIARELGTTMSDLIGEEVLADLPQTNEVPHELIEFAKAEKLTKRDIQMLMGVNFRGQRPQDIDSWRLIWGAIKAAVR